MGFYLSPYTGSGTRQDPFRPVAADAGPGWAAIDLRPDPSTQAGYAFLYTPQTVTASGVRQLTDNKLAKLSNALRNFLSNRLGATVDDLPFNEIVAALLMTPPSGKWKALQAVRSQMRHEIWLGPGPDPLWSKVATLGPNGELIDPSDTFNRANETPVGAPWAKATGANVNLSSNMLTLASNADTLYYYAGSVATADQFSQAAAPDGGSDIGAATRVTGTNGYLFHANAGLSKYVSGGFSVIASVSPTTSVNDVLRLESEGSTLRTFVNGVATSPASATDTSLTAMGDGAGFWMGTAGVRLDDWQGGDLGGGATAQTATPTGLGTANALGSITVVPGAITSAVTGLASANAFGTLTARPRVVSTSPGSLASAGAFGSPTPVPGAVLAVLSALASAGSFGAPGASTSGGSQLQVVSALLSAAGFGTLATQVGAITQPVSGIGSTSAFGAPTTASGATVIAVTGLDAAGAFGALTTEEQIDVLVSALTSAGAFGTPTVSVGPTTIAAAGLGSEAFFGAVSISGGVAPTFLPSILGGRFKK